MEIICPAMSRARARQSSVRIDFNPANSDCGIDIGEALSHTDLQLLYPRRPDGLIEPEPQDQRRHAGPHDRCGGARAAVVDGRLAAGKNRGVTDRIDELDMFVVIEFGQVIGPGADEQAPVQLRGRRDDHVDDVGGR